MSIGNIKLKKIALPDFCNREILRYAGAGKNEDSISELLETGKNDVSAAIKNSVVYREFPIDISGNLCSFGSFSVSSHNLAKAMAKAERVIFMAATLGVEIDRIISKYSKISPSRALIIDAIAAERIEAICDTFCQNIDDELLDEGLKCGFRFSPGYGDLPLEFQSKIFSVLIPEKYIGLTLNKSLMMSPSKSVSAIVALERID